MHFFALGMHQNSIIYMGVPENLPPLPDFLEKKKVTCEISYLKKAFKIPWKCSPIPPPVFSTPPKQQKNKQTKSFLFFSSDFFLLGVEKGSGPEKHEVVVLVLLN